MIPITFQVKSREGYIISKWSGTILDDEILNSYRKFFESSEWSSRLNELVDCSRADMQQVNNSAMWKLGKYAEDFYNKKGPAFAPDLFSSN